MNMHKFIRSLSIILPTLVAFAFIYSTDENPITEINTQKEFYQFLNENPKVIVQFYSPTCPVCNMLKKKGIYLATAQSLGDIKFVMTSSVHGEKLHRKYQIESFPTFILYKNAHEFYRFSGYSDNPHFTQKIRSLFSEQEKG